MAFNEFTAGVNTSFSSQLNTNFNRLGTHTLKGRLLSALAINSPTQDAVGSVGTLMYLWSNSPNDPNFIYDIYPFKPNTTVDTTNSTCLYTTNRVIAFCDVLDIFNDNLVSSVLWSTSITSNATISESSSSITLAQGTTNTAASITSSGASGLNIHGQNAEIILDVYLNYGTPGSTPGTVKPAIQLSNGSTHVDLFQISSGSTSQGGSVYGQVRIVYDHTNTRCDVFFRPRAVRYDTTLNPDYLVTPLNNEYLWGGNIDVSTVTTNKYIRLSIANGNNGGTAAITCYGIGYRKHGAGAADADYVVNYNNSSSVSVGLSSALWCTTLGSTPTSVFSTDGTTSYGSDNMWEVWGSAPSSGTSIKAKLTVAKPTTIIADTPNIPVLVAWGMLLE